MSSPRHALLIRRSHERSLMVSIPPKERIRDIPTRYNARCQQGTSGGNLRMRMNGESENSYSSEEPGKSLDSSPAHVPSMLPSDDPKSSEICSTELKGGALRKCNTKGGMN